MDEFGRGQRIIDGACIDGIEVGIDDLIPLIKIRAALWKKERKSSVGIYLRDIGFYLWKIWI